MATPLPVLTVVKASSGALASSASTKSITLIPRNDVRTAAPITTPSAIQVCAVLSALHHHHQRLRIGAGQELLARLRLQYRNGHATPGFRVRIDNGVLLGGRIQYIAMG